MSTSVYHRAGQPEKNVWHSPLNPGYPKYLGIKNEILYNIRQRVFLPGECIPPESWYCATYGVSPISVRKAFSELIRTDVLYAKQGKGTFVKRQALVWRTVAGNFADNLASPQARLQTRILAVEQITDAEISRLFGAPPTEPFTMLKRLRMAGDEPTAVSISYTPLDIFSLDERIFLESHGSSLYRVLAEKRIVPHATRETFSVGVLSDKEIYTLLKYGRNEPLIFGERFNYSEEDRLFEYTRNYLRSDIYKIDCSHERILR